MIYIDTSALLKLVLADEVDAAALGAFLATEPDPVLVSSSLINVEARRGITRANPGRLPRIDLMLIDIITIPMSEAVVEDASRLADPFLRSLDAIHLATALLIRDDIDALLTYDNRLATAAQAHSLAVSAPR